MPSNNEVVAAVTAGRNLVNDKLPGWEADMISDDELQQLAVAMLSAAETVRSESGQ